MFKLGMRKFKPLFYECALSQKDWIVYLFKEDTEQLYFWICRIGWVLKRGKTEALIMQLK